MANQTMKDLANNNWNEFARLLLMFEKNDEAAQKIRRYYFGNESNITEFNNVNMKRFADMFGDRALYTDMYHGARLQTNSSPVYLYYYSYPGEWTTSNIFLQLRGKLPRFVEAVWSVICGGNTLLHRWMNYFLRRTLPNYGKFRNNQNFPTLQN